MFSWSHLIVFYHCGTLCVAVTNQQLNRIKLGGQPRRGRGADRRGSKTGVLS